MRASTIPPDFSEYRKMFHLPEIIRQGRSITANVQGQQGPPQLKISRDPVGTGPIHSGMSGLSGTSEFWNCLKNTPITRANECLQYLLSESGEKKEFEIDIFDKHKIPVKFELKPNWVWFVAGFLAAWIIKS